jgi:hypothetical protein
MVPLRKVVSANVRVTGRVIYAKHARAVILWATHVMPTKVVPMGPLNQAVNVIVKVIGQEQNAPHVTAVTTPVTHATKTYIASTMLRSPVANASVSTVIQAQGVKLALVLIKTMSAIRMRAVSMAHNPAIHVFAQATGPVKSAIRVPVVMS